MATVSSAVVYVGNGSSAVFSALVVIVVCELWQFVIDVCISSLATVVLCIGSLGQRRVRRVWERVCNHLMQI